MHAGPARQASGRQTTAGLPLGGTGKLGHGMPMGKLAEALTGYMAHESSLSWRLEF